MSVYANITEHYDELFPLDKKALAFAIQGESSAQHILEIGCATGCLGEAMKNNGYKVMGIDFDRDIIEKARRRRSIMLEFQATTPSLLDFNIADKSFHQVLCFNNTLPRLPNEMAIEKMVEKVRALLKDQGVFKGSLYNYDRILSENISDMPVLETDSVTFKRHHRLEQQFLECYTLLIRKDSEEEFSGCVPLFPVKKAQLEAILKGAGFTAITFYDDFDRTPYTGTSDMIVFEAR